MQVKHLEYEILYVGVDTPKSNKIPVLSVPYRKGRFPLKAVSMSNDHELRLMTADSVEERIGYPEAPLPKAVLEQYSVKVEGLILIQTLEPNEDPSFPGGGPFREATIKLDPRGGSNILQNGLP
jgi:hypothetical protein